MEANLAEPLSLVEIAGHVGRVATPDRAPLPPRDGPLARPLITWRSGLTGPAISCSSPPCRWSRLLLPAALSRPSHFSPKIVYRELYARSPQQERADRKQMLARLRNTE